MIADMKSLKIRSEDDILARWAEKRQPMVSFVCTTYNHAAYIKDALQGFLVQETSFPYEIICYDDFSSDGTREIIEHFQRDYPNLIKTIFPDENKWSKGINPVFDIINPKCLGKYIAHCEGDDYWTDPKKIQIQVDFLEKNPDYVLTTHDIVAINAEGDLVNSNYLADFYKRDFDNDDLINGWAGPVTQAMVFRRVIKEIPDEVRKTFLGDVFLASILGHYGKSKYFHEIQPSAYRLHGGGVFSTFSNSEKLDMQAYSFFWMYKYYKRLGFLDESRVFKLKLLEKMLREIDVVDFIKLFLVRFFSFNLKKIIS